VAVTSPISAARRCVLHIDDDPDVLALVGRKLGAMVDVISSESLESALSNLARHHVDLIILDIGLGKNSGLELLPKLRDATGNVIPVIIFSTHASNIPCDDQVNSTLCKENASLDDLTEKIRDRLALIPANVA
jgi:DNA-binding NtrC family response regulator